MARARNQRDGAAVVELAILLPLLVFLFVIGFDFARVFYYSQVLANCARNGAVYGSNLVTATSPYQSIQEAALADATNLDPQPTVTSTTGTYSAGNPYVKVTVSWDFRMIATLPNVSNPVHLSRSAQMRIAP